MTSTVEVKSDHYGSQRKNSVRFTSVSLVTDPHITETEFEFKKAARKRNSLHALLNINGYKESGGAGNGGGGGGMSIASPSRLTNARNSVRDLALQSRALRSNQQYHNNNNKWDCSDQSSSSSPTRDNSNSNSHINQGQSAITKITTSHNNNNHNYSFANGFLTSNNASYSTRGLADTSQLGSSVRTLTKRSSLASAERHSPAGRTYKTLSLPEGRIITQLHGRKMSGEGEGGEESSSRGTPTKRPKRHKHAEKRRQLYRKFRLYCKICVFCIREARAHILRNKAYDEISPYLNTLSFYDLQSATEDVDLLFDVSKFKADKQLRISEETKRILGQPSCERSDRELHYAQIALRNIASFVEYPMRMQRKIAEVGRYERYESKRVLVRQGHPASAFYFILSGSVVVMVYEGDTRVAKPVAYLRKGQTFGELAIIQRTTRQSTVIAKENIELLSIDIEDFHNIFMAGGVKNIADPDHNEFLRSIPIFSTWPLEKMLEHPDKCVFHYFKRSEVLVRDSNYSDWIFIVKSGSIKVMKKLKRVKANESKKKTVEKEFKNEKMIREERAELEKQRRYILPDLKIPLSPPTPQPPRGDGGCNAETKANTWTLTLPVIDLPALAKQATLNANHCGSLEHRLRMITHRNNTIVDSDPHHQSNASSKQSKHYTNGMSEQSRDATSYLPTIQRNGTFHGAFEDGRTSRQSEHNGYELSSLSTKCDTDVHANLKNVATLSLTEINLQNVSEQYKDMPKTRPKGGVVWASDYEEIDSSRAKEHRPNSASGNTTSSNVSNRHKNRHKKNKLKPGSNDDDIDVAELVNHQNNIRTITHDLDANARDPDDFTEADLDPLFVHIQTLTKGQVFGVAELILGEQPSLCLVSGGVECVMLNKDFYMRNASEALLRSIRHECSPYPIDRDMQNELQSTIDWAAFKTSSFRATLDHRSRLKALTGRC